jgi:peptide/nickel transport system substrate-binding protein
MKVVHAALAALATSTIAFAALTAPAAQAQQKVIRITPHANLAVLDPIWTTAYMSRNHGYMVFDTLFGMDDKNNVRPQMLEKYEVSADKKTWTFVLRDGLAFHDGAPVTSEDCIASLKRWATRDTMGIKLATFVEKWESVSPNSFRMVLKEPYGLVLDSLGKPSSNVPFIMPKRIADTPGDKQLGIPDQIGSGPYKFKADEYKPGEKIVYVKNETYKPRSEPVSALAGGKKVNVDRIEWVVLKDPQTQFNALVKGEIDVIEQPAFEQYESLAKEPDIEIVDNNPLGFQYMMRFNHLTPPFNNPKIRRAAMLAVNQSAFLNTQVGKAQLNGKPLWRTCASMFPCGTPYATDKTDYFSVSYDEKKMQQARALLKEAGYDGKPILIMRPTDLASISKLPLVATQLLRQAGFTVDMQSMDWGSLVARRAKKEPVEQGGWNIFLTAWVAADLLNPIANAAFQGSGVKSGWFGWAEDAELEKLRDQFAREPNDTKRKALAEAAQLRAIEIGTHAHLGEYINPAAVRKGVKGLVQAPANVYWNISKL